MKNIKLIFVLLMYSVSIMALPKIAVVDFDASKVNNGGRQISEQLSEYIVDELVNANLFEVVEREKMSSIMTELGFSSSGMVSAGSAAQMGKLLGAKYLMTGKVISVSRQVKKFNGYGVSSESAVYTMSASVRIFDVEKGSILFSTKEKSTHSVNAGGGLSIKMTNVYEPLIEEMATTLITTLKDSSKFANSSSIKTVSPKMVKVIFNSIPEFADVEVDGVFYGNTGDEIEISSGQHVIKISMSGYVSWEKKVMISENTSFTARLSEVKE